MKRSLSLVLALGLIAAVFASASAATCSAQYTVKPGDNLFRIGLTVGVPWPQIAAANNLSHPSLIFPGQVLCIPVAGSGTPVPSATLAPSATPTATATGPTPTPSATPTATSTGLPTATVVATATPTPSTFVVPTFSIVRVVKDTSVTIQTANFPTDQDFNVTMGPIGSSGIGGTLAATTNSGVGGTFTATYPIPAQLAGVLKIAIRLQSASGYYSFNWFYNVTAP